MGRVEDRRDQVGGKEEGRVEGCGRRGGWREGGSGGSGKSSGEVGSVPGLAGGSGC